jgi:hypothetical protein
MINLYIGLVILFLFFCIVVARHGSKLDKERTQKLRKLGEIWRENNKKQ